MAKKSGKVNNRSKRYPVGFQRDAVERMKHCEDIGKLAEELGVSRGALYLWRRKGEGLLSYQEAARRGHPAAADDPQAKTIRQLEAKVASLEGELAGAVWKQVFSKVPCEQSRGYARRAKGLAQPHLRRDQ